MAGSRGRIGWALAWALLPVLVVVTSCGYHLSGTGGRNVFPERIQVIAVTAFENRTDRPEIDQRVTEAVTRELSQRGGYKVVTDPLAADAILEGAVVRYSTQPVEFSAGGRTTRIEALVTIQAILRERETDGLLWSQTGLLFREQFDVPETGEFFDQETLALDDLARGVATNVVTSMLEGW